MWVKQLCHAWTQILHLVKRIISKSWGVDKEILSKIADAVLVSKVLYGMNCQQRKKRDNSSNTGIQVLTGLSYFTMLEDLYEEEHTGKHPDRVEVQPAAQILCLKSSELVARSYDS